MSSDPSTNARDELRAKIEASERRIAERTLADQAQEVAEAAVDYTRKNPLTVVAGAIALGVVIGAMTKPGRRAVQSAATGAADVVNHEQIIEMRVEADHLCGKGILGVQVTNAEFGGQRFFLRQTVADPSTWIRG